MASTYQLFPRTNFLIHVISISGVKSVNIAKKVADLLISLNYDIVRFSANIVKGNQSNHNSKSDGQQMPWRWELKIKPIKQLEVRENVTDQVVIGLRFVSDWSREWREFSGRCDWRIKSRYLACQKSAIFAGNQIRRDRRINSPNMSSA